MSTPVFDQRTTGYTLAHAYAMALAAQLAYKEPDVIERRAAEWGFKRVRHHRTRFEPPFPLEDTQAYTMAGDHMIVTAFRGTETDKLQDWLSDASTPPWPGPAGTGFIHYGFGQALDSVFPDVRDTLAELRDNDQTLWLTGHSLGGALAMLAASRLHFEDPHLTADGIYTFGQPRTCDRLLAEAHDKAFAERAYRFVNDNDVVPHLPPEPAYHHTEVVRFIAADGGIHDKVVRLGGLAGQAKGFVTDKLKDLTDIKGLWDSAQDAFRDHKMARYVAALEKHRQ
ncbi:lipase family protein [Streptomyces sp. NPDC059063]|uniref:lipase family protein n=1 Tax=unclassified Streptomyces TaxID=2593676 RepID=UPI00368D879B